MKYEISFIDAGVKRWLESEAPADGLCLNRFRADFTVEGLIEVEEGGVVVIGEDSYIICKKGKRCFAGCGLLKRTGKPCPLAGGVAFGRRIIV